MNRREILKTLGTVAVAGIALPVAGQHEHHHHGSGVNQELVEAASACSSAAEACLSHCVEMLAAGDKSMAPCSVTTREVAVVCGGLRSLAAQNAPHLSKYAAIAAESCKSCEAECRKHPQHDVCKACADACAACAKLCSALA